MPHVTAYVPEEHLAGREEPLIAAFTDAVAAVYGEWARELVTVLLVGVPAARWGTGGRTDPAPGPVVDFGIRAVAFDRPDAADLAARLVRGLTDAVGTALGPQVRPQLAARTYVELTATPAGRSALGGELVD